MQKQGYTVFTGPLKHGPKGQKAVRKAEKQGQQIITVKKTQHTNKHNLDPKYVAKIMNDQDDHKPKQIPHDLRIAIAQARNAKGLTQQQFAHLMCVPKSDVNSWQNGKLLPNGQLIAKMDKVLGVKLPRPQKN